MRARSLSRLGLCPLGLVAVVAAIVAGATAATPARADDPTSIHLADGLPPFGDALGSHDSSGGKLCTETYEVVSLTLDSVTVDGAPAPLDTNAQDKDIQSSAIFGSRLGATTVGGVKVRLDYTTSAGRPYYFEEAYDAK